MASPIAWLITIGTTCSVRPSTILTSKAAPRSKETRSRTRAISFSQVFTYARLPLERMKSSVAIDTDPPYLPRAARAVGLIFEPTTRPALAAAPTAERPAAAVERTMALPGRRPTMAPATPNVIDPSPDLGAGRHSKKVGPNGGSRNRCRHGQGRSVERNQHEVRQDGGKPRLRMTTK